MRITDNFGHSKDRKYGENLYKIEVFGGGSNDVICGQAVKLWYDEIKNYNFDRPNLSFRTFHASCLEIYSRDRLCQILHHLFSM
jgi:hypothetical protein